VLVGIDASGGSDLVNQRFAYVSISRGAYDAKIFTNDMDGLSGALSKDVSKSSTIEPFDMAACMKLALELGNAHKQSQGDLGL